MQVDGHSRFAKAEPVGQVLRHPLIIAMLVLWLVNDHVLKDAFANELTGKLSDVASLAVFPLVPLVAYEVFCALRSRRPQSGGYVLLGGMIATGMVMVGINVWEPWAEVYRVGLGALQWPFLAIMDGLSGDPIQSIRPVFLTMDPTDAYTLPALAIPWWVAREA